MKLFLGVLFPEREQGYSSGGAAGTRQGGDTFPDNVLHFRTI